MSPFALMHAPSRQCHCLTAESTRWLYCVECPQYSIRLEALAICAMPKWGCRKITSGQSNLTQAGWFLRPDFAPSSERQQFWMPPVWNARRASITACRCCLSTAAARWCCTPLPASAYHLIGGGWQNGRFQNLSPPSVLFESHQIFLQYTGDTDAKKDGPEFWNSNSVIFENFLNFQKGVARSLCADLDHYGRGQTRS